MKVSKRPEYQRCRILRNRYPKEQWRFRINEVSAELFQYVLPKWSDLVTSIWLTHPPIRRALNLSSAGIESLSEDQVSRFINENEALLQYGDEGYHHPFFLGVSIEV
jgi:hypothetical protein